MRSRVGLFTTIAVLAISGGLASHTAAAQPIGSYHLPVDPSYQEVNSFALDNLEWTTKACPCLLVG
ncbi:hypothetical protein EBZ39_15420 [bacterium]|nr:hypothetical protein [bacterium]